MPLVITREAFEHRLAVLRGQRVRLDAQIGEVEFWLNEVTEPELEVAEQAPTEAPATPAPPVRRSRKRARPRPQSPSA